MSDAGACIAILEMVEKDEESGDTVGAVMEVYAEACPKDGVAITTKSLAWYHWPTGHWERWRRCQDTSE